MRAYLSIIGTAGGIASGASRREDRELAKAGRLDAAGLEALRRRSELARKAALARWGKMDKRVVALSQEEEDPDRLMGEIQRELRAGNRRIAADLARLFRDTSRDSWTRGLALETLSATRIPALDWLTYKLIIVAMGSEDAAVRFAGIASAGDLPWDLRERLAPLIAKFDSSPAAEAFLRRVEKDRAERRPTVL
jgi:hypothetical protein